MDAVISEFIDILTNNSMVIKFYKPEWILNDDPRFDNFEFDENLLIESIELSDEELWKYLEFEICENKNGRKIELNHFSNPSFLENFLEGEFQKFKFTIANSFNTIDKAQIKEVVNQIKNSRNELELLQRIYKANKFLGNDSLISTKLDFCNEAIRFLDYSTFIFSNRTPTKDQVVTPNQVEVKPQKTKKPLKDLTDLTQNQVIILFHYLRQQGLFAKGMPKNVYSQYISELTGFTQEKIRQDLSHIDNRSQSLESVLFTESDYSITRRALEKIVSAIKADSEEKFS